MEEPMKRQGGFTILEVFISFSLFAIFATVFLQSQNQNVYDSLNLGEEVILKQLCEGKINEVLIDPPEFNPQLDGKKETKSFDYDGYENYKYTIEYKKFEAPDLAALLTSEAENEDLSQEEKNRLQILSTVFEEIKKKIETIFWQVRVSVENTNDGRTFDLSTWFLDPNAQYELNIPLLGGGSSTSSNSGGNDDN